METTDSPNPPTHHEYDVVIIGGAFSGASAAILIKRQVPDARILIIERSTEFDRKVGESTSEVAGCFLTKVLRLGSYLSREHIVKHGLHMWFSDPKDGSHCPSECSEIGPAYQVRLPTYQIDRSKLDTLLLEIAGTKGCDIWRPATVRKLNLVEDGDDAPHTLEVKKDDGQTVNVNARFVIDASGKAALTARKHDTLRALDSHPTSSMWVRYTNVNDIDGWQQQEDAPGFCDHTVVPRYNCTNHLMGYGWWCWIIPLGNGETSVGLTWDRRLFTPPEGDSIPERLKTHLVGNPLGNMLFKDAIPVSKDARVYQHLPYYSEKVAGNRWFAIGDAAGFMDPLYSQGLDYCAHTAYATANIIASGLDGNCTAKASKYYSDDYVSSYHHWFNALYKDKYRYLGDVELMNIAFLLDIGCYFIGPVRLVYNKTDCEFSRMPYNGPIGTFFAKFMGFYNQRLVHLAEKRRAAGTYGKKNRNHHYIVKGAFTPDSKSLSHMRRGIMKWLGCEFRGLFLRRMKNPPPPPVRKSSELPAAYQPNPTQTNP